MLLASTTTSTVENAALLEAMARHATRGDWPSRRRVYETLLQASLILPLASMPTQAPGSATSLQFRIDKKPTGERVAVVFTDEEAMRAWGHTGPSAQMATTELFSMLLRSDMDKVYINPFKGEKPTQPGGWLTRAELEVLSTGTAPTGLIPHGFQLQIKSIDISAPSAPLDLQTERALIEGARRLREIRELFYFDSSVAGGPPHPTIGVVFGFAFFPRKDDAVIRRLMSRVQPEMARYQMLDVVPVRESYREGVVKRGVLLYARSRLR